MENNVEYDKYDAFIHGYDEHTGSPVNNYPTNTDSINILNSYIFMTTGELPKEVKQKEK